MLVAGRDDVLASIPTYPAPAAARRPQTTLGMLLKLDCPSTPGITCTEFRNILGKCRCGLVMTRRVLRYHDCAQKRINPTVIDLTQDSDDDGDRPRPMVIDLTLEDDSE
jgi:hypothetical protein